MRVRLTACSGLFGSVFGAVLLATVAIVCASLARPVEADENAKPAAAESDAQAEAGDSAADDPQWVWFPKTQNNQAIWLRKEFTLPENADLSKQALLFGALDDRGRIKVNNQPAGETQNWTSPIFQDVASILKPGKNQLAIFAENGDGAAGALLELKIPTKDGGEVIISTDGTWQSRINRKDAKWQPVAVLGKLGDAPWKKIDRNLANTAGKLKEPETTPVDTMKALPGFEIELVYDVPQDTQGSWVNLCPAPDGRLIASDQYGSLYWVTPGDSKELTQVEAMDLKIGFAQGLLWAFDSLYVMTNSRDKYGSAFYRCTDTDGDGQLDNVKKLITFKGGGGEHGPHAIVLTENGEGLYLVLGNQTELCKITSSRVPEIWGEDILTPRVYGKGFMRDKLAPGGYVLRVDPDGVERELVSIGYRNQYDAALNHRGDLFTYDADMEWDWNTPWYRPTRVCQIASGSDFGWRNGSAKWPAHWPDSYPPTIDIGPGSPTGVTFGYGAEFPAKYQDALYVCDWTYGKLYAIHLTEQGAGYAAKKEEFVIGTPLPLTDAIINPHDGAMYFALGGRRIKSGLYRVKYTGDESTEPVARAQSIPPLHQLRHQLEDLHIDPTPDAVGMVFENLGHDDEQIRYAARVALEQISLAFAKEWDAEQIDSSLKAVMSSPNILSRANGAIAASHVADAIGLGLDRTRATVLDGLLAVDFGSLSEKEKIDIVRAVQLALIRLGEATDEQKQSIVAKFGESLEGQPFAVKNDLYEVLVYCGDPQSASKGLKLLSAAATQEQQIAIAKTLRLVDAESDWSPERRREFFEWFHKAQRYRGGASFELFVKEIQTDALAQLSEEQVAGVQDILDRPQPGDELGSEPREFVKEWTLDEAWPIVESGLTGRDFEHGRQMFAAAKCAACHRYGVDGGAIGPDLTALAGRFSPRDLLTHTIDPNKEISDQYAATTFLTIDGRVITGRVVNLSGDALRVNQNMLDPNSTVTVDRKMIDEQQPSKVSMMPSGLLNTLNDEELLDLMAYLLSRGDANGPMFGGDES